MEFWDNDFNSCFIRRGSNEWSIYTSMKYSTLTVCVTVPDNLLERYKQYKQQIVELLKDATYHDITPGKEFGTVFEMKTDTKGLDNAKAYVATIDKAIVAIMKPLWEMYKDIDNWTLDSLHPGHSIQYHKPDMKCLETN